MAEPPEPEPIAIEETGISIDTASGESESDLTTRVAVRRASVSATDWTIETLVQQMRKGRIDLDPKFQRRSAWTDAIKSRFIESAILNFPIPQVVLAEQKDRPGHYLVIDGKQRLLALRQFYAGMEDGVDDQFTPLKLTGMTILKEPEVLKGTTIRALQGTRSDLFDSFENHTIRTVVVRNWEVEDFLYTLFLRLNTGAVPLSPQELRQALVPGPFVDFIDAQSGDSRGLQKLLGNTGPDRRMIDAEILLRFVGFQLGPVPYKGNLKLFLDGVCKAFNAQWQTEETIIRSLASDLEDAIAAAMTIFGSDGACHKWSGTRWERAFNRAVFDVQIGALASSAVREVSLRHAKELSERFKELCVADSDFSRAISTTTKSLEATGERFSKWYRVVNDVTGSTQAPPSCLTVDRG
jgi:hypothetical protein